MLFTNTRVHSGCTVQQAVIFPDVVINRGCRLTKVVIDKHCVLPAGLVVGEDPAADARRFYRSPNGVVLITKDMLKALKPEDIALEAVKTEAQPA